MKKLKVCNVKNIYETRTLGRMQVPFLGYHLISDNDFLRMHQIKACTKELKNYYKESKSILVTKERDISVIKKLVKEFEFDGVQLHYEDSYPQIRALRTEFEQGLIIFQVVSTQSLGFTISDDADYVILDKSFMGGTGLEIGKENAMSLLQKIDSNKIFLAGGIGAKNIDNYLELNVIGFDVQSSVKSDNASKTENINYTKLKQLVHKLGYTDKPVVNGIGFVALDINQKNRESLNEALQSGVDLVHVDISEGVIGPKTDLNTTKSVLKYLNEYNSHIPVQVHIFASTLTGFQEIQAEIKSDIPENSSVFLHINRDNYEQFDKEFLKRSSLYFGLDVRDIIEDVLEWENYIGDQVVLCLQSKENPNRLENLNSALKLIKFSNTKFEVITIDRGLDFRITFNLFPDVVLNAVYGSNLNADIGKRFYLLKRMLYGI